MLSGFPLCIGNGDMFYPQCVCFYQPLCMYTQECTPLQIFSSAEPLVFICSLLFVAIYPK